LFFTYHFGFFFRFFRFHRHGSDRFYPFSFVIDVLVDIPPPPKYDDEATPPLATVPLSALSTSTSSVSVENQHVIGGEDAEVESTNTTGATTSPTYPEPAHINEMESNPAATPVSTRRQSRRSRITSDREAELGGGGQEIDSGLVVVQPLPSSPYDADTPQEIWRR
jgi:hypothetical protein